MEINLKEVAKLVLEKQPYKIVKESDNSSKAATEQSIFVDVLSFSVNRIGSDFNNFPYGKNTCQPKGYNRSVSLIGIDGEIVETVACSKYSSTLEEDLLLEEKRKFKFVSDRDIIIVAYKLTAVEVNGKINNYLLFLSKPFTIGEMQDKRDIYYKNAAEERVKKNLQCIKYIWN